MYNDAEKHPFDKSAIFNFCEKDVDLEAVGGVQSAHETKLLGIVPRKGICLRSAIFSKLNLAGLCLSEMKLLTKTILTTSPKETDAENMERCRTILGTGPVRSTDTPW